VIIRFKEIAKIAALGAPLSEIGLFTSYQIIYMSSLAIPVSCLLASWILFQRLSHSYEIIAWQASGLSLMQLLGPILTVALYLSFFNFYTTSEWGTHAYYALQEMKGDLSKVNPLSLLKSSEQLNLKNIDISVGYLEAGRLAKDVAIVFKNKRNDRLALIMAKEILSESEQVIGNQVTIVSTVDTNQEQGYDHLLIENQQKMYSSSAEFSAVIGSSSSQKIPSNNQLNWNMLAARLKDYRDNYKKLESSTTNFSELESMQPHYHKRNSKVIAEMLRRIYIAIAPLSFTWLGATLGIEIGRQRHRAKLITVILLASLFITAFFVAKAFEHSVLLTLALYTVPHTLIGVAGLWTLRKLNRGDLS
jgi:lipopolysaccharide export system permease protein